MEVLKYRRDQIFNSRNLVRVGDLISFEGPMLTLFKDVNSGALYLFDWVDRDQDANRWLIYKVNAVDLMKYIKGEISHYTLFDRSPDRKIYFADIARGDKDFDRYILYLLDSVPDRYTPLKESYFDAKDCPSLERIEAVISSRNKGNIQIGDEIHSIPEALHEIADHIKEAKELLDYPADWDDEGALPTDEPTFNHAAQFVLEYARTAYEDHRIVLTIPYIDIMKDGSVSVLWESEKAHMLIIFKLWDHDVAYYYAEQKDKQIPTKSAIDISGSMDRMLFSWMITCLNK